MIEYNIIYHLDSGENNLNNPLIYTVQNEIEFANPSKIGYNFNGWYKEQDFINIINKIDIGNLGDINVYAKFIINQYTINFDTAGGSEINAITQDYNSAITPPDNPSKNGFAFLGWLTQIPNFIPNCNINC